MAEGLRQKCARRGCGHTYALHQQEKRDLFIPHARGACHGSRCRCARFQAA